MISNKFDRIVAQKYWNASRFQGANIVQRGIDHAMRFPWIKQPQAVSDAFAALLPLLNA